LTARATAGKESDGFTSKALEITERLSDGPSPFCQKAHQADEKAYAHQPCAYVANPDFAEKGRNRDRRRQQGRGDGSFSVSAAGTHARSGQGFRPPEHGCTQAFASIRAHKEYVGLTSQIDAQE
jgi:hypothetical protein